MNKDWLEIWTDRRQIVHGSLDFCDNLGLGFLLLHNFSNSVQWSAFRGMSVTVRKGFSRRGNPSPPPPSSLIYFLKHQRLLSQRDETLFNTSHRAKIGII